MCSSDLGVEGDVEHGARDDADHRKQGVALVPHLVVQRAQYWNMVYGHTPGQVTLDEEGMQTMRTLARNMAWMIRKLNVNEEGHPELESPLRTNFIR